jgi:hypothetical protein
MFISTPTTSQLAIFDGIKSSIPGRHWRDFSGSELKDLAWNVAHICTEAKSRGIEFYNTNTIDAELQRTVVLQDFVRAFATRIVALQAFSTVFYNQPLEGTDKVAVPYFPLQTAASTDWNAATGYTFGNTTEQVRDLTINKRKYQGMAFLSYEQRRQPTLNLRQLAVMNAEKLVVDVFTDIVSNNITVANFGASVKAVPAQAFTAADVADLYASATTLMWPDTGRSLTLDHNFKIPLLKDNSFKQYLSYGSTDPIRRAMIQDAYGFEDIYTVPNLAANYSPAGEFLTGWINHKSALLIGFSPIRPTQAVEKVLAMYQIAIEPESGICIEYRLWGVPQKDTSNEIVEANYGVGKGVDAALARITSQ